MTYQEGLIGLLMICACAGIATLFVTLGGWIWRLVGRGYERICIRVWRRKVQRAHEGRADFWS